MPRSGRCRCGQRLRFEMTARGHKTRCPKCRAVVRLRGPGGQKGAAARAESIVDYTSPDDLLALGRRGTDAPVALAEMPAFSVPAREAPAPGAPWWLLASAALAVVAAVGGVTALLSL